jgi:hypothetical protein
MFYKISFDYISGHKIKNLEVTFNQIDLHHKTDEFNKPFASLFLNSKEALLPKYKDYKLVDMREAKNL